MTNFILNLFLKKNTDPRDPVYRANVGRIAGLVGIFCNLLLFAAKGIGGFLAGSISVTADAVNNLSDAGSSIITLLGFHLAQRPADPDHPFGHARYEYLSGLAVAYLIVLVGFELGRSSISKILHPIPPEFTLLTFGILLGSILLKLWLSRFFGVLGNQIDSTVLQATALDSRNDFLSTSAVLAGCLVGRYFGIHIDGLLGLCMAGLIIYSGFRMTMDTISPLLGKRADPDLVKKLQSLVLSHDKILGVHDLLVHDYGPGQCFASLHAELSAQEDPLTCHDIIDDIESAALTQLNVHLVIHYDPVVTDDPEWNKMHALVEAIIHDLDPRFSMHDFRMVRGAEGPKLVFDLAVPYKMDHTPEEIKRSIETALAKKGKYYPLVVHFDFVA